MILAPHSPPDDTCTLYMAVLCSKSARSCCPEGILAQLCCLLRMSCCPQVEFNKAALSLSDALPGDKKAAMNRLLKVGLWLQLTQHCAHHVCQDLLTMKLWNGVTAPGAWAITLLKTPCKGFFLLWHHTHPAVACRTAAEF